MIEVDFFDIVAKKLAILKNNSKMMSLIKSEEEGDVVHSNYINAR
jgi:hypothetical protein